MLIDGKELNEEFGLGWNDYGARWYDAAVGRWNAIDPLAEKYLSIAPYAYVANNPIKLYDPDGMRIKYSNDISKEDKKVIKQHIQSLRKNSKTFKKMWKDLKRSNHTHEISSVSNSNDMRVEADTYSDNGSSTNIYLHPTENSLGIPQEIAFGHEIGGHAWRFDQGLEAADRLNDPNMSNEDNQLANDVYLIKRAQVREMEATHIENVIRSEMESSVGLDYGKRQYYGSMTDANTNSVTVLLGTKTLNRSSVRVPGTVPNYNYQGNNHYEALKKRKAQVSPLNQKTVY